MARLVKELLGKYPGAKVKGHRDYSPDSNGNGTVEPWEWIKACPCFEVKLGSPQWALNSNSMNERRNNNYHSVGACCGDSYPVRGMGRP